MAVLLTQEASRIYFMRKGRAENCTNFAKVSKFLLLVRGQAAFFRLVDFFLGVLIWMRCSSCSQP